MSVTPRFSSTGLEHLISSISGRVLRPGDPGYDDARRVHNGMIDRRPALIVRCQTADDAAAAVRFARAEGLDITVRGGGHNVAGRAVADDAVMIDLAEMKAVQVDPEAQTVRAEGGVIWGELNACRGRAWAGRHRRRDLVDRHRRADARRRARLADEPLRPGRGQPDRRRAGPGRWLHHRGRRDARIRTCSGRCAAAGGTSGSRLP